MRETSEEPVIGKEARVNEEVVVQKTVDQRTENVQDTVRETKVDVDGEDDRSRNR
jgi:stress response protein YsnF